jgi:hypothetical protein
MEVHMTRGSLAAAAILLALFVGCANQPTAPLTPAADIHNDSLCFFTASTDPSGLKVQCVFSWGDGDTSVSNLTLSGDTVWCNHAFADTGTFRIKARARNERGRQSKWSPECTFHASHPPQLTDTIAGPVRWVIDHWYRVSVRVVDPEGDSVALRFIWSDSTPSAWTAFVPSGSVIADSFRWTTTGQRRLHVALKDKGSMTSLAGQRKILDVADIAVLWDTRDSDYYSETSPTVGMIDGQTVIYVATEDALMCFDAAGRVRWANFDDYPDTYYAPSLSSDGLHLYVGDLGYGLACFDTRTGRRVWMVDSLCDVYGTPVAGPDGTVYVTNDEAEGTLCKVRDLGDSARVEWSFPIGLGLGWTSVALGRNGVAYCCRSGDEWVSSALYAVDTSGQMLWADTTSFIWYNYRATPVIDSRGRIVVGDDAGFLRCVNPDGTIAWSRSVGEFYVGGITVGYDDRVFLQKEFGPVLCFDASGSELWEASSPVGYGNYNSVCAVSDSSVLVCSDEDVLFTVTRDGDIGWVYSIWDSLEPGIHLKRHRDEGDECNSPVLGPDGNIYLSGVECLLGIGWHGRTTAATAWPTYNHDPAHSGWAGRPLQ